MYWYYSLWKGTEKQSETKIKEAEEKNDSGFIAAF